MPETSTLTLSEFLLARYAEDQSEIEHEAATPRPVQWGKSALMRRRLDIEAKRRTVEWHTEREDCCEDMVGPVEVITKPEDTIQVLGIDALGRMVGRRAVARQPYLGCVTLAFLAVPFSQHPDYRPEWRPPRQGQRVTTVWVDESHVSSADGRRRPIDQFTLHKNMPCSLVPHESPTRPSDEHRPE